MSVCIKFSVGAAGSAGARVLYDTKERATKGEPSRVWTKNVPEYVDRKGQEIIGRAGPGSDTEVKGREEKVSYKERRANLAEYARQKDEDEKERSHEGKGETRSYYRAIYSYHKDVPDEKAIEMVDKHQGENFSKCIIINSLHRNAEHVHVHSIIFARQIDDKKLQLGWKSYRSIDESWARIYGQEFGAELELEHLRKKEERRAHRQEAREAKQKGEAPTPRPIRVSHERNQIEERKNISLREHGITQHDDTRIRGSQRPATGPDRAVERATAERATPGTRRRERAPEGRDRAPERATPGEGGATREPERNGPVIPVESPERAASTGIGAQSRGGPSRNRTKSPQPGIERSRSREGAGGGRAQAGEQAGRTGAHAEQRAGSGVGSTDRGNAGTGPAGEHYVGGLEASSNNGHRPYEQGGDGPEPGRRESFAGEIQNREPGIQQQDALAPVRPSPGKSPEAAVDAADRNLERQSGLGVRGLPGNPAAEPGALYSGIDLSIADALRPLHDQREKERDNQEQLEAARQQQEHELEHELEPGGRTLGRGEQEQPEPSHEIERSIDLSFDR